MADLPYTYVVRKPSGRAYWRFRRGDLKAPLPGAPGDAAYHAKYAELLALSEAKPTVTAPESIAGLVAAYKASAEFHALRGPTQLDYGKTLDLIVRELGEEPYRLVTAGMVKAVRDDHAATPRKAHKIKQMVSRLYTWAAEDQRVRPGTNPAASFKRLKVRQKVIVPWSDTEIAMFLAAAPAHLRLAMMLLLCTGQRIEDVATMEWTAFQGAYVRVRQSKTGEPLEVACHATLRQQLEAVAIRRGRIVRSAKGRPYTANGLAKAIGDCCAKIDGFPAGRSPHGLRYAAAGALEEAGCTPGQIIPILGHRTYQMAVKYLIARRESAAAMAKLERRA